MTHEPERVEDIIREMAEGHQLDFVRPLATRLSAALSHERESKRLAVMKVAEELHGWRDAYDGRQLAVSDEKAKELAAALRKAVE